MNWTDKQEFLTHAKEYLGYNESALKAVALIWDKFSAEVRKDTEMIRDNLKGVNPEGQDIFMNICASFTLSELFKFYFSNQILLKMDKKE